MGRCRLLALVLPDLQGSNNFACRRLGSVDLHLCRGVLLDWGGSHYLLLDDRLLFDSHCGFSSVRFWFCTLYVKRLAVDCQLGITTGQILKLACLKLTRLKERQRQTPPSALFQRRLAPVRLSSGAMPALRSRAWRSPAWPPLTFWLRPTLSAARALHRWCRRLR